MLGRFLFPGSVAVVGAADDSRKLRGKLFKLALGSGFSGPVYPVHPTAEVVQGHKAYPSLASIPGGAELVLIATPGATVPAIVAEAIATGSKGAVILSSGVDQAALDAAVGNHDFRYMGPNTEGYVALDGLAATFAAAVDDAQQFPAPTGPGRKVAIVSQSGGLGFALFGRARRESLNFSAVITTGNEGDVECLDAVEEVLEHGDAGVIVMFVEGLKSPSRLKSVAAKAADKGVPIIIMKVGRSEAGQRAAISHTAHLTGADTAYDAVFDQFGILRVFDSEEMLAATAGLARFPKGRVRKVAIVTTSGGAGAWAADLCGAEGIDVPLLSDALQLQLNAFVPGFGSSANPVDATAQAVDDGGVILTSVLNILHKSDEVDAVIVNMGLAKPGRIEALRDQFAPVLSAAQKPILFHSHILPIEENFATIASMGGQAFHSLRGCVAALRAIDRHAAFLETWEKRDPVTVPAEAQFDALVPGVLDEAATSALLNAYAVPVAPSQLIESEAGLIAAIADIGEPVVLKIQSPDIAHKTEAGGVALGVTKDGAVDAYQRILANARDYAPNARIEGVLVQKMMPKGREVVVGVSRDPDFGPLVMLGAGGIYLEVLKDVVFRPAPISRKDALEMIARLKTAPILAGTRGEAPGDLDALADLIVQVGNLATAETLIDQLDLNPVFVYPKGQGVVAVDALAVAAHTDMTKRGH